MMRRIIATSLRFRFIVIALAACMMIFGAAQVRAMPVDVFPEFAPPKVEIQTICIGLSAEEVEQLVTVPIEQSLAGIEGLETIRSKSVIQLSQVVLLFKPGTNELKARQLVAERIAQITPSLPTWAAPPVMLQPLSATSRVMKIGLQLGLGLADRPVDDLVLDDPTAAAERAGRRQRRDLGRAARHAHRAGDAGPSWPSRASR